MTLPSKLRRKKPPEALDWRELARGPALRGLAEVLATPPEVAKERAEQRAAADQVFGRVVGTPTVGLTRSERTYLEPHKDATEGVTPTVVITTTVGVPTSEVVTPTVVERSEHSNGSPHFFKILDEAQLRMGATIPIAEGDTPSVGEKLSEVVTPTVAVTLKSGMLPPQADKPTVGATPLIRSSPTYESGLSPTNQSEPQQRSIYNPLAAIQPTAAVTPSVHLSTHWVDADGNHYDAHRVQRVAIAQQSMALGEERVYQALWHAKESDGVFFQNKKTKIFSLGYDRLARLVRLNEKSVRMLLPKLISKKILEVVASENSATRTGRKYRVFSYEGVPAASLQKFTLRSRFWSLLG
jgi:hypothetical protein